MRFVQFLFFKHALVSPALHGLAELFSYRILINGVNWERFNSGGISECI